MTSILIGLFVLIFVVFMVGSVSALFLVLMTKSQALFLASPSLVWALPLIGLATGWVYWHHGRHWPSTSHVLTNAEQPTSPIPLYSAVSVFCFTILSQLFGASTGRESTAVLFGAGLSEFLGRKTSPKRASYFSREVFVRCGLAAGFGAVFGVPWAGTIFALEATSSRKWVWRYLPLTLLAAFGANTVAITLGASHKIYPTMKGLSVDMRLIAQWAALGVIFGLVAKLFLLLLKFTEKMFLKIPHPWLRPAAGGLLVAVLTSLVFQSIRFNGLGLPLIEDSLTGHVGALDFVWKSFFTVFSTGSGLKGGEVTPLMSIGASLGAAVSAKLLLPAVYAASLGLVCVFASAAHLPWTGAVMAWEFFGFEAFLPAFIICWVARQLVGRHGLYLNADAIPKL